MFNFLFSPGYRQKRIIFNNAKDIISYLAVTLGERTLRKYENLKNASEFISNYFIKYGYPAVKEEYYVEDKKVYNIITEIPGHTQPEKIILIGAHYDTIENCPGADDNASAVAGLLELYRLLSEYRFKRTIRFVAFTLEEPPYFMSDLMGSMVNAKNSRARNDEIDLMVCLEMIGYAGRRYCQTAPFPDIAKNFPKKGDFLAVVSLPSSSDYTYLWKSIYDTYSKHEIRYLVGPSSIPGISFSDHYSFNRCGYSAIMLTDTGAYRNKNYHTECDTIDCINFKFMSEHIYSMMHTVKEIADMDEIIMK